MNLEPSFPPIIDNTMRSDYASCPRRFFWRHIMGLTPLGGSNINLVAGAAFAKAYEAFRISYYENGDDFETAQAWGVLALLIEYGDPGFDDTEQKSWFNVTRAFMSALRNWNPASDYIKPAIISNRAAVEFSFALPIDAENIEHPDSGDPLLYHGRFDMIGEMNGSLFGEDDKTTKALGAMWSDQWELRSQFTGYTWGAREFGHNLAGFVIRGTAILKTKITHAEAVVFRPQFMIDDWHSRLWRGSFEMVDKYITYEMNERLDAFPQHGMENNSCSSYGGCPFSPLCRVEDPWRWIEGNYEVDRWDPSAMGRNSK